jgi:hydroxyacylglutathione hydrolase
MSRHHFAKYQRDELVFAEGSEGDEFFIVVTGHVGLSKKVNGGHELLHQIGPGELFGELAVISSTPRSASAVALEPDTSVISVDKVRFLYLVSQHPGFAVLVMKTLSRWLRKKTDVSKITSPTSQLNEQGRSGAACTVVPIEDNVWQLRSRSRSCNSYLFKGRHRTILVDAGLNSSFDALMACLNAVGPSPITIDTIILTHEHFDHIAAVPRFTGRPVVAAHRLTAHKIANQDDFALLRGSFGEDAVDFGIEMILDEGAVIDTGDHRLRVFHTPGHTSGSISLLEERGGLLITGDLVLASGNLGGVFGSGSVSDMVYSLETLGALHARVPCLVTVLLPRSRPRTLSERSRYAASSFPKRALSSRHSAAKKALIRSFSRCATSIAMPLDLLKLDRGMPG